MAQRKSEYERKERDLYETPEWVAHALKPYIPHDSVIWEPACASGKLARAVNATYTTDLVTDYGTPDVDFLKVDRLPYRNGPCNAIITNPPFGKEAEKFARHALKLLDYPNALPFFLALLLPTDFDAAGSRHDIFEHNTRYSCKLILTKRIVWFERTDGKKAAPSMNHAWYMWTNDKAPAQRPIIRYYYDK